MLKRCAEVENHRRLVRVADGGGVYELAFDEVAYTGPAGGHPCRERQMELEHKAGGSEGLARLAAALQLSLIHIYLLRDRLDVKQDSVKEL